MRVLSVVSLLSPDGAYGGPTTVALNQARALRERGHDVVVAAGVRGYDEPPSDIDGVPIRPFSVVTAVPGISFAGLTSPGLVRWVTRVIAEVDVVHVHLARDLVTMPVAAIALSRRTPYVVQPHGMIDPSGRRSAHVLDALATRRVLRGAAAVLNLTDREAIHLVDVNAGPLRLHKLANGVPDSAVEAAPSDRPEVLFLARLHRRKRPVLFATMAQRLASSFPDVRFSLVGPDEGEGSRVEAVIADSPSIRWEGSIAPDAAIGRMRQALVYVLPSVDEPFPMSVLEAMSVGLPVVVTDSCGLARLIEQHRCGTVFQADSLDELVAAVASLLADRHLATQLGQNGRRISRELFSMAAIAEELERVYRSAVSEVRE